MLKENINKYAIFYFSIIPFVYLFDFPDKTFAKNIFFIALSIPFMVVASGMLRRGEVRLERTLILAVAGFMVAVVLSGAVSLLMFGDLFSRRLAGIAGLLAWMVAFLGLAIACEEKCLNKALQSLAFSILVSAGIVYFLEKTMNFFPNRGPQLDLGLNSISLGKLLLAGVPGALLVSGNILRLALLFAISILVFMTGARTIAIALLATVAVFAFPQIRGNRKVLRNVLLVLIVGGILGIMGALFRGVPFSRLITLQTLYLRFEAWMNTLDIWWRMNPFTGVGPGMHRHYLKGAHRMEHLPYAYQAGHAHNDYLAALADLGVIGFLAWGGLLTLIFVGLWRRRNENQFFRVSLAIFVGYLVASLTEIHFMRLREMTLVIVVMVLGLSALVYRTDGKPA